MFFKKLILLSAITLLPFSTFAKKVHKNGDGCGSEQALEHSKKEDPELEQRMKDAEEKAQKWMKEHPRHEEHDRHKE